jgi:hypothetical protein
MIAPGNNVVVDPVELAEALLTRRRRRAKHLSGAMGKAMGKLRGREEETGHDLPVTNYRKPFRTSALLHRPLGSKR